MFGHISFTRTGGNAQKHGSNRSRATWSKGEQLPELRGKSAQIRSFMPVLVQVWANKMDPENTQHRDVLKGLTCSARIDDLLHEHRKKPRLPLETRTEFRRMSFEFCAAQSALVAFYHPGTPLHNITSKSHYLMHIGMISSFMNPSLGACWQNEDMMKLVRKLCASSSYGSPNAHAQKTAMYKYSRALGFELAYLGRWWA